MLSVVVPTYNERDNIDELIHRVLAAFSGMTEPAELLIVDDNSPDGTAARVREVVALSHAEDRVRVVQRSGERGLAQSVIDGFHIARGEVLAVMDADLSHPPELLPELLQAVRCGCADFALASRYISGGGVRNWPFTRWLMSRLAGMLAWPLVGVTDPTSGYFLLKREALRGVRIKPRGYKIGLELLAQINPQRVTEVPFIFSDRAHGASKLDCTVMLAYLVQLATLLGARYPRCVNYMHFSTVGLLGMAVDAVVFIALFGALEFLLLGSIEGAFIAQTISFLTAAYFNFIAHRHWTFRDRAQYANLERFLAVSVGGYLIRSVVFLLLLLMVRVPAAGSGIAHTVGLLGVEQSALVAGIVAGNLWNFFGSRRWAFPKQSSAGDVTAPQRVKLMRIWLIGLLATYALCRVVVGARLGLAGDEAYYWQWSRHLALGYYDHPPMIAYLIATGTNLLGNSSLGVRLVPLLMTVATAWMVYYLALRYWASERAAMWAVLVFIFLPLFAVGGLIATPDTPLLFFWTATVLLTIRAYQNERVLDWILAGVFVGLGVLSKYSMALLPIALIMALLAHPRGRLAFRGAGPWLAVMMALAVCLPSLVWSWDHNLSSVLFQLQHGFQGSHSKTGLKTFGQFLLVQPILVSPILFGVLVWIIVRAMREQWLAPDTQTGAASAQLELRPFLLNPAILTILLFGAASWFAKTEANWTAPAYITASVLLGGELARFTCLELLNHKKILAWTGIAVAAIVSLFMQLEALHPMTPFKSGPLTQVVDRSGFQQWATGIARKYGTGTLNLEIFASNYRLASLLAFYLPDHPQTDSPFEYGSGSEYAYWRRRVNTGQPALYFTTKKYDSAVLRLFEQYQFVNAYSVLRKGVVVDNVYVFHGKLKETQAWNTPLLLGQNN